MVKDASSKEAERRIQNSLKYKHKTLDLSRLGLKHVPKEIKQLQNLKELHLYCNELNELPAEIGQLKNLDWLHLSDNELCRLPSEIGQISKLIQLYASNNRLKTLPSQIGQLINIVWLNLSHNEFSKMPSEIGLLSKLTWLNLSYNQLKVLPSEIGMLSNLMELNLYNNQLSSIPLEIGLLEKLEVLNLHDNPLEPELQEAYDLGIDALKKYLRTRLEDQIEIREAKLILVGEGEVGKTCLMDALRGKPFKKHDTTHGIQIHTMEIIDSKSGEEITLNGWDFGGQKVYRPTHQLFFSSPAVYLVVWKPREGAETGRVEEWIKLVLHREPEAKILVVATHGGPTQRKPDINRQDLIDKFGKDTILGFFHIDSKPENGNRIGIEKLKQKIAETALILPETSRAISNRWRIAREKIKELDEPYIPLSVAIKICTSIEDNKFKTKMTEDDAQFFIKISHQLGYLIHYEQDELLKDYVILRPDWLATAVSLILEDKETEEKCGGLAKFSRLSHIWDNPERKDDERYPETLHKIFVRLMERFDISYPVFDVPNSYETEPASLIAQLVPDMRPKDKIAEEWPDEIPKGEKQQSQICQIVDSRGQSANAEGLFYQLIVRLHKYSLGRDDFEKTVHWQRGLILEDSYNGRALLEHKGNDIHITVRAPYPSGFLTRLTEEVRYLVDNFWEGLKCNIMVPCIEPCGGEKPGTGLFPVDKLIESKKKNRNEYPCPVCPEWQNIDRLLQNAQTQRPQTITEIQFDTQLRSEVHEIREILITHHDMSRSSFDSLSKEHKGILSKIDEEFTNFMQLFNDEAKEGPRLFSFEPVQRSKFNPLNWMREKFKLTLWCEHSNIPLPYVEPYDPDRGVIEIELTRKWLQAAGPYLKLMAGSLSMMLPVAAGAMKLALDATAFKVIEDQLSFGMKTVDAVIGEGKKISETFGEPDITDFERGWHSRAEGAALRELHVLLKQKDPTFGGLIRVVNRRKEFLWVHEKYVSEY